MAKCPTCNAPVNLAPDGDPKYVPPLRRRAKPSDIGPRLDSERERIAGLDGPENLYTEEMVDALILATSPGGAVTSHFFRDKITQAIRDAVSEEREACAKVADDIAERFGKLSTDAQAPIGDKEEEIAVELAQAIRNRGDGKE